jgi:hypothetical protein
MIESRGMRWAGHVARMGWKRNAYRLLVGKPEERRSLGRPRRRWLDNIRMDLVVLSPIESHVVFRVAVMVTLAALKQI